MSTQQQKKGPVTAREYFDAVRDGRQILERMQLAMGEVLKSVQDKGNAVEKDLDSLHVAVAQVMVGMKVLDGRISKLEENVEAILKENKIWHR